MEMSGEQTLLQFVPSPASVSARVHPLVIFNIYDGYVLRPDQEELTIGTLLGSVLPDGTVDIRTAYVVPHQDVLDIDYHHRMLSAHQKVNPEEVVVGWFSTGFGVTGGSALINDFYTREVYNPVHLTVDNGFENGEAAIKGFVSTNLSLGDQQIAAHFQEIPLDLRMFEAERIGFVLKPTNVDKLPSDLEALEASMEQLLALIDDVYEYVDNVVERCVAPDNKIGRFLSETVASLPKLSPHDFDKLVNDGLQDQLILMYLSRITRTHISVAEELDTAAHFL